MGDGTDEWINKFNNAYAAATRQTVDKGVCEISCSHDIDSDAHTSHDCFHLFLLSSLHRWRVPILHVVLIILIVAAQVPARLALAVHPFVVAAPAVNVDVAVLDGGLGANEAALLLARALVDVAAHVACLLQVTGTVRCHRGGKHHYDEGRDEKDLPESRHGVFGWIYKEMPR
jgi:hypothetical protein